MSECPDSAGRRGARAIFLWPEAKELCLLAVSRAPAFPLCRLKVEQLTYKATTLTNEITFTTVDGIKFAIKIPRDLYQFCK